MRNALRAFSLGYEGISLDRYLEVLKENNICVVVDVRETPWSYKRGFSKKPLAERLQADGIFYLHLKSAGNPSRNRKMGLPPQEVIERYKDHLDANPACLDEIYGVIRKAPGAVCLLCFEREPHECHRKVILDRIARQHTNLVTSHLHGAVQALKEPLFAPHRIPQSDNGEGSRIHVEVAEDESSLVSA